MRLTARVICPLFLVALLLIIQPPAVCPQGQPAPLNTPTPHAEVMPLLEKGYKHFKAYQWSDALRAYEEALEKARTLKDRVGEGEALNNIGNVHLNTGQIRQALPFYEQALPIRREVGHKRGEASTLSNLGLIYRNFGQMDKARQFYGDALTLFKQMEDKSGEARTVSNLGIICAQTGELEKGLDYFTQSLAFYKQVGDKQGEADILTNIGNVHRIVGFSQKAVEAHTQALALYKEKGNKPGEAKALTNLGNACFMMGEPKEARAYYEQALKLDKQLGDKQGEAETLNNLGQVYRASGQWQRALQCYEQVLPYFQQNGNKNSAARVLANIGNAYQAIGQWQKAQDYLEQALLLYRQTGNVLEEASVLAALGIVHVKRGQPKKGLSYYEKALSLRKQIGEKTGEADLLNAMGLAYHTLKNPQKALSYFESSRTLYKELTNQPGTAAVLSNIGYVCYTLKQLEKALQYYEQALPIHRADGNQENEGTTLTFMGLAYADKGQPDRALPLLRQGLELREAYRKNIGYSPSAKLSYLTTTLEDYHNYIALLSQQKQASEAFDWTQKVKARVLLDLLQGGRIDIQRSLTGEERTQEQELQQHAAAINARMIAESVDNAPGAKRRYEALQEEQKKVENDLQAFTDRLYARYPTLAMQRATRTAPLSDVARYLPEDTALLEYVHLINQKNTPPLDEVLLIVVTQRQGKAQISLHTVSKKGSALNAQFEALRKACADPIRDWKPQARALYKVLIAPAEKFLQGRKRLIICPDRALWDVPFATLVGEGKGKREKGKVTFNTQDSSFCLWERFEIAYAYSATGAIAAAQEQQNPQRLKPMKTLLAMTNPAFGSSKRFAIDSKVLAKRPLEMPSRPLEAPSRVLAPLQRGGRIMELPGTQKEADALKRDFTAATFLNRERAQETTFKTSAEQYRYLHLATHGFTNDAAPLMSSLVLAEPPKNSADDGFLTAREIADLDLRAELVVLSACNTGRGERKAGEGIIGLTWALFVAGCPNCVVSQWSVSDRSTAQLMATFYRNLKQGQSKSASLRTAALRLKQQPATAHPYYWAPFVLFGDGS